MSMTYDSDRDSLFDGKSSSSFKSFSTPPPSPITGNDMTKHQKEKEIFQLPTHNLCSSFKVVQSNTYQTLKIKILHKMEFTVKIRKDKLKSIDDIKRVVQSKVPAFNNLELSFKNKLLKSISLQNLLMKDVLLDFILTKDMIYINVV